MNTLDRVNIVGLKIEAGIGAYDWEQGILQTVEIDLTLFTDTRKAGASDNLADALDYHAVSQQIQALLAGRHFQLIEAMAACIADDILRIQPAESLAITITKPGALTNATSVSVTLKRYKEDLT